MNDVLEMITGFVTRENYGKMELLFIDYQENGVQIPVGVVDDGEAHLQTIKKEVEKVTGLSQLKLKKLISYLDLELPEDQHIILNQAKVHNKPDFESNAWFELRRGLTVTVIQRKGDFTQVEYSEIDQSLGNQLLSYQIIGWVQTKYLTQSCRRYFYHLSCEEETPRYWDYSKGCSKTKLFWAPLTNLPDIVPQQIPWVRYFFNYLENKSKYVSHG